MKKKHTHRVHRSGAGFTLFELMLVVVLLGILAVSVIPAMGNVQTMRNGAARDDIARMLETTRARAMASGEPKGLRVNPSDSMLDIVEINPDGSIQTMSDPLTGRTRSLNITTTYPGVQFEHMINGDGIVGAGIVWFDYEGTPHMRDGDGVFIGLNTQQVEIMLSSESTVVVHAYSGVVESP